MGRIGFQELLILAVIVVVLFGARKIPELLGGFGEGIKAFKKGIREDDPPKQLPKKDELPGENEKPA